MKYSNAVKYFNFHDYVDVFYSLSEIFSFLDKKGNVNFVKN